MAGLSTRKRTRKLTPGSIPTLTALRKAYLGRTNKSGTRSVHTGVVSIPNAAFAQRRTPAAAPQSSFTIEESDYTLCDGDEDAIVIPALSVPRVARVKKELEWQRWVSLIPSLIHPYCEVMLSTTSMRSPPSDAMLPELCPCGSVRATRITLVYMDCKSWNLL